LALVFQLIGATVITKTELLAAVAIVAGSNAALWLLILFL
jgi:hypothetical protein